MPETPAELLRVDELTRHFDASPPLAARLLRGEPRRALKAVDGVSFSVSQGSTFALVGESGCGKSTLARCIAGLQRPTAGRAVFRGQDLSVRRARRDDLALRRHIQMVFQDPYASLNPRWRVADIIAEPIRTHGLLTGRAAVRTRVEELLELVKLSPRDADKFPHQFSGGQRQRLSIARALAATPDFIVCDEPTSALDVSVQAQILNLMRDLQDRFGLTYLLISHNLAVVAHMADFIAVMYLGRFVEWGRAAQVLDRPRHPYTRLLLETVPRLDGEAGPRVPLAGELPNPIAPPRGCHFHPRCPLAGERCRTETPLPRRLGDVLVACHAAEA